MCSIEVSPGRCPHRGTLACGTPPSEASAFNEQKGLLMPDPVTPDTPQHPRRRRLRLVCAASLLIVGAFAGWLYIHRDPVTTAKAGELKDGMTLEEVHALLGRSPDYKTTYAGPNGKEVRVHQWDSAEVTVCVEFDDADQLIECFLSDSQTWYFRLLQTAKRSFGLE
jgi:hypothetical protein